MSREKADDAISRQAVNEIINDIRDCISVEGYCAILERMKKLPPVKQDPCEDAISRQAVIKVIYDHNSLINIAQAVRELPPVNQQPKTGHWIETDSDDSCWYMCSECHRRTDDKSDYCPNCGRAMVEPQESCDTCKHKDEEWDSEPCDECCGANSKWSGESYPGEFEAMEHNGRLDALESEDYPYKGIWKAFCDEEKMKEWNKKAESGGQA